MAAFVPRRRSRKWIFKCCRVAHGEIFLFIYLFFWRLVGKREVNDISGREVLQQPSPYVDSRQKRMLSLPRSWRCGYSKKKRKKRHLYGPLMRSTHSHCVRKASWHQYVCQFMIIDVRVSERKLTRKNPPWSHPGLCLVDVLWSVNSSSLWIINNLPLLSLSDVK